MRRDHRDPRPRRAPHRRLLAALLPAVAMLVVGCAPQPSEDQRSVADVIALGSVGPGTEGPNLFATADGRVHMTWIASGSDAGPTLRTATLRDGRWAGTRTIARDPRMFVNWADFPSLVETPDGTLWAHWLRRSGPDTYAYDVMLSRSTDGGTTWDVPITPHRDGTATEHGFVSLVPGVGGEVTVVWLDGRNYAGVDLDAPGPPPGSMTLRAATLAAADDEVAVALLDGRTCDCCQTAAVQAGERLLVAYRDRSAEEIRDISVVSRVDGQWGQPEAVATDGWMIPGCPVNGPSLTARDDRVAVTWFAMVDAAPEVKLAFAEDDGFESPLLLERDGGGIPGHATLGRVDAEWIDRDTVLATWLTATDSDRAEIRFRTVDRDGSMSGVRVLAETHPSRASGFPRIVRVPEALVAAWTVPGEGIETAMIPLPATR